jgi:hypothetical protein
MYTPWIAYDHDDIKVELQQPFAELLNLFCSRVNLARVHPEYYLCSTEIEG